MASPRDLAKKAIEELPDTATWEDVLSTVTMAAVKKIPADVYAKAVEVFDSEDKAAHWLLPKNIGMGGVSPFSILEAGKADEVLLTLGRIEYGVYG